MTHQSIARINLAKTLTGSSLYALEHYRYGCPGENAQFQMTGKHPPTDFHCPLCMQEKTKSLPSQVSPFTTLLPIGERIHMDFSFYKVDSIRGFRSFLMCIESRTSYQWAYLHRNKKPPIKLIVRFAKYLRRYFGFSVCVIRTDGGGESWGSQLLRATLSEMESPVLMEPTGAETPSASGKAERSIGLAGVTTQCLLGMANLEVVFWCFALIHGVILLNVRPNSESGNSRFEALFKKIPNLKSLRIFGSTMYKVDQRLARRRPDSATRSCIWLGLDSTPAICNYMDQITKSLGYAHHYVIDELDTATLPGDRGLAAKVLSGFTTDGSLTDLLRDDFLALEPDVSPWLPDTLVNHFVPALPPRHHFGFCTEDDANFSRVKIISLIAGSFAAAHLLDKKIIGMFLLAINGIPIHSATDISDVIDDLLDRKEENVHCTLTGFNFLFGKLTDKEQHDDLSLQAPDYATSRVIMALNMLDQEPLDDATFRSCEAFADFFLCVSSIHPNDMEQCPTSFGKAMQDPVHRAQWRESLFNHLSSCYSMGTYGCPTIPPPGATILPAVIVLKLVLNQLKQAAARKTSRICVNGSVQIQGRDYEESYTPILLAPLTKILIAIACYLNWQLFHFDVHNAFQSTPDPGDIHGNRAYLRVNREWLEYIKLHKLDWWREVKDLLSTHSPGELAVKIFMFVQGRALDVSLMWAIEVEDFIANGLKLVANRANPCVYSGIVNGHPVILGRATDDFLCACESIETYDYIVTQFCTKWKIHSLGIVRTFFSLNFIITEHCVTIDQTIKCEVIISQVLGPSWRLQKPKGTHTIPMKAGTKYAELLARSPPLSDESLLATEESFGFKYRSVLGACVHFAIWTRLDILQACVVLAQFQTNTGIEHFEALKHLVGHLRRNPDIPLTFCRKQFDASVSFLHIEINEIDPMRSEIFSSSSYHVGSVDLISRTRELTIASALLFETEEARQVLPGAIRPDTLPFLPDKSTVDQDISDFPESVDDPIDQLPRPRA
jgi:hypothetical protein